MLEGYFLRVVSFSSLSSSPPLSLSNNGTRASSCSEGNAGLTLVERGRARFFVRPGTAGAPLGAPVRFRYAAREDEGEVGAIGAGRIRVGSRRFPFLPAR